MAPQPALHLVDDEDVALPSIADIVPEEQLSHQTKLLIEYASKRGGRLPKSLTKQSIKQQFETVFEMIGGVPRLAIWADENPSMFFAHYAKLLPIQAKVDMSLPPTTDVPQEMSTEELRRRLMLQLAKGNDGVH